MTPRTKAGRVLHDGWARHDGERNCAWCDRILAIEQEAAEAERARLLPYVQDIWSYFDPDRDDHRSLDEHMATTDTARKLLAILDPRSDKEPT